MGVRFPLLGVPGGVRPYWQRVLKIRPLNLIGYYRLNELSGAVANDSSGNARHGTAVGITWEQTGWGNHSPAAYFDGANDYINLPAGLVSAFLTAEGTCAAWFTADNFSANRDLFIAFYNSTNYIGLVIANSGANLTGIRIAAGTTQSVSIATAGLTAAKFYHLAMTWSRSNDRLRVYLNGAQSGTDRTGLAAFAGAPSRVVIGALSTVPQAVWLGKVQDVPIWNVELTPAEIAALAK